MLSPHSSEVYKCNICTKSFTLPEINRHWKCPDCSNPMSIKVTIGSYDYNCNRLKPSQLKVDFLVTLDRKDIYQILSIMPSGSFYSIALKGYGVKNFSQDDFLLVIDGAWVENY